MDDRLLCLLNLKSGPKAERQESRLSARAFLLTFVILVLVGCAANQKKESFKELKKLSLDSQQEAAKLLKDGNENAAIAKYQEALRYHPSPSIHKELGDVLMSRKQYEEARSHYKLALAGNPEMTEAGDALDQIEARIRLAESRPPAVDRPLRDEPRVTSATPGPPDSEYEDFYDEELAFEQMEEIAPPSRMSPSPRGSSPSIGSEEVADSLMEDTRELFGLEDSSEDYGRGDSFPTPDLSDDGFPGRIETASVAPPRRKSLGGGRGLIGSGRKPSILTTGHPSFEDESPVTPQAPQPDYQERMTSAFAGDSLVPSGRPGERGLRRTRLPDGFDREVEVGGESAPPSFAFDDRSDDREGVSQETSDSGSERSGWLRSVFDGGDDEIEYPDAPAPEIDTSGRLGPAYPGREEIDLRGMSTDRWKGKQKPTLDLEICKKRYYEEKDLEGAVRCFADKRIDFPDEPELYYQLGLIYQDAGSAPRALRNFEMALRYAPENPEYRRAAALAQVQRAKDLRESKNLPEARRHLVATIDEFPEMVEAHREIGKVYIQEVSDKKDSISRGAPETPDLLDYINARLRDAEAAYETVVRLAPDGFKDWYNLGWAIQEQYDSSKTGRAIRAYEKAIQLNPEYASAHRNLAILYESQSVPKAIEHYRKALAIGRSMPEDEGLPIVTSCLSEMGRLYWKTGDTEMAAKYLTEYLQYVPEDAAVEEILDQITSVPPANG